MIAMQYNPIEALKAKVSKQCTQSDLAAQIGISPQYLSEIINGRRPPNDKVIDFLGWEKLVIYRPKRPRKR